MNSTGNQTAPLTPGMICSNEAELVSMATVQFLSFLANWVAVIATSKLPGLEENKYHLVVRTPTGCQRPPDPNHNASILYHLLCNLFVDWRRDFLLSNCVHFRHFSKLVFCYSVYNVPTSFSGSYKAFVLQKRSYICESAED